MYCATYNSFVRVKFGLHSRFYALTSEIIKQLIPATSPTTGEVTCMYSTRPSVQTSWTLQSFRSVSQPSHTFEQLHWAAAGLNCCRRRRLSTEVETIANTSLFMCLPVFLCCVFIDTHQDNREPRSLRVPLWRHLLVTDDIQFQTSGSNPNLVLQMFPLNLKCT